MSVFPFEPKRYTFCRSADWFRSLIMDYGLQCNL
jgi:hypothetical protein